jgi:UDP-N-acetylmuramate-alanine ligase
VGAEIPILGTNAYWNQRGEYFVAEGDESDGTLRCFHPEHALILNIEEEHLDFYPDLRGYRKSVCATHRSNQRKRSLQR